MDHTAVRPKCSDPLQVLNYDCVAQVLDYLPPRDIIRLEAVSLAWKALIRWYTSVLGIRRDFPYAYVDIGPKKILNTDEEQAGYEQYKSLGMYEICSVWR
jgi:hypothetical protein